MSLVPPRNSPSPALWLGVDSKEKTLIQFSVSPWPYGERVYIFDFTTAGDWDCVAAVERLPALHYSVDFIFLSFGIMGFIVEL